MVEGTEGCDDGNLAVNDGCDSACVPEAGYSCTGTVPSVCSVCGNGAKASNENCDDGNLANNDGCSSVCV